MTAPQTPFDAALDYTTRGWRVVPIMPGQKRPPMQGWQNAATTDRGTIDAWYTSVFTGAGLGIATGKESGVWVLDIDNAGGKRGDESLIDLEAAHGPLPDTVEAVTGSGGRHLYFAWPADGREIRNSASGRAGLGIDVRGEGGQVLAPPTIHPNGQPYRWLIGHAPDEIDVAPAPEWLLELVVERPRVEHADTPRRPELEGDSIAAAYNNGTTWRELLTDDGWTLDAVLADGEERWRRPGKPEREGISATVGHEGRDVLTVFTSSVPGLTADTSYSRFGYTAATKYAGDRSAAARAMREVVSGGAIDIRALVGGVQPIGDDPIVIGQRDDDWTPIDLAPIARGMLDGTYKPIAPEILAVKDALPLFYRARINSLFGESGGGKTWVALAAIAESVRAEHRALLIDFEDNANGITERLVLLGLTPEEIGLVDYISPSTALSIGILNLQLLAVDHAWLVIVVDSTGEAMAAGGIDSNDDGQVARWFTLLKHLARLASEPSVIALDHIPKDKEAPSAYAIGSQRKRAAVTGAAYRVDTLTEPARGKDGRLRLVVAKDRPGNRAKGSTAAVIDITSTDDSVTLTAHLSEAQEAAARGERFRPTVLMERVSRWLEINPGASGRQIEQAVTGKGPAIRTAIEVLIEDGFIVTEFGERNSIRHRSAIAFRENSDLLPVDNSDNWAPRPSASHRVPDRVPDPGELSVTASPNTPLPLREGGSRDAVDRPLQDTVTATPESGRGQPFDPIDESGLF